MRRYDLHQAEARAKSLRLFVCIFLMQLFTVAGAGIGVGYFFGLLDLLKNWEIIDTYDMTPTVLIAAAIVMPIVFLVMIGTGIFKYLDLRGGGIRIAEMLHARPIPESTENPRERQLLNIVSELAISSGIPAPPVFVMDNESGINALAAGQDPSNAVIVVTEGTLKRLGRDQIQGVMAHEFSHILNGDIRRSMLLMAISHGNFSIISLAQGLIESEPVLDDLENGNAFVNILLTVVGCILWPVGAFGACIAMFFTSLIKCQDEFKADATAVEMTRLPNGLAEALMMIGGNERKASIRRSSAFSASHLFFADSGWSIHKIFDSHPPLDERIIRLDPGWDGCYLYENEEELGDYAEVYDGVTKLVGLTKRMDDPGTVLTTVGAAVVAANTSVEPVDRQPDIIDDAPEWMCLDSNHDARLDPLFIELASDGQGAGLVLAAVHLDQFAPQVADEIISRLNPLVSEKARQIHAQITNLTAGQKITMFDVALENLRSATSVIRAALSEFANCSSDYFDDRTDLEKWAWQRLVRRRLDRSKPPRSRYPRLNELCAETALLISAVIHTEPNVQTAGQYTFMRAMVHTDIGEMFKLIPQSECTIERIEHALDELAALPARERRKLLVATGVCVTSDREITVPEAWILRVVCQALNFPMPKLVPEQPIAAGL